MAGTLHVLPSSDNFWVQRIQGSMAHISSEEADPAWGLQTPPAVGPRQQARDPRAWSLQKRNKDRSGSRHVVMHSPAAAGGPGREAQAQPASPCNPQPHCQAKVKAAQKGFHPNILACLGH